MVRLSLAVVQKKNRKGSKSENAGFQFCIIDLDESPYYPDNFVCFLPKQLKYCEVKDNVIFRVFGKDSLALSKELLTEALNKQCSTEVRSEIFKRLQQIN